LCPLRPPLGLRRGAKLSYSGKLGVLLVHMAPQRSFHWAFWSGQRLDFWRLDFRRQVAALSGVLLVLFFGLV